VVEPEGASEEGHPLIVRAGEVPVEKISRRCLDGCLRVGADSSEDRAMGDYRHSLEGVAPAERRRSWHESGDEVALIEVPTPAVTDYPVVWRTVVEGADVSQHQEIE
jgi:hypothetical protein